MKYILVSEEEYRRLFMDGCALAALETAGVNNWSWYGEAFDDFVQHDENLKEYAQEKEVDPYLVDFDEFVEWLANKEIARKQLISNLKFDKLKDKIFN